MQMIDCHNYIWRGNMELWLKYRVLIIIDPKTKFNKNIYLLPFENVRGRTPNEDH